MSMIKCPECGKEVSDLAGNCPNCGFPLGFESTNNKNNQSQPINNIGAYNIPQNNSQKPTKMKNSTLSTWAAICAFFTCTIPIGVVLAIIDLKNKDETKKHTGSWFAIIFGSLLAVVLIVAAISGNGKTETEIKQNTAIQANSDINNVEENTTNTNKETVSISDEYINITSTELIDAYNENQVKCKQNYDGKLLMVTGKVESIGTDIMDSTYVCLGHDTEFTFVGIQCYAKDNDTINEIAELKEGDLITVSGKGECGSLSFSMKNIKIEEVTKETYIDENGEELESLTSGQSNALKSAKSYLDFSAFSYDGLISQLEYEQYSHEDAVFAADNCGADWNEQAVKSAKSYLEFSSFSRDGLIEQLEYEGFTHEQAVYGVEKNGY